MEEDEIYGTEKCPHGVWDYEDGCYQCEIDALKRKIKDLREVLSYALDAMNDEVYPDDEWMEKAMKLVEEK